MIIDLSVLKAGLSDIPDIDALTETTIGGRRVYGLNGMVTAVDINSSASATAAAIRQTIAMRAAGKIVVQVETPAPAAAPAASVAPTTPIPPVTLIPAKPKANPMSTPAPGSFAASLKAMMDEAKSGLALAQTAGRARVQEAVGKFADATVATGKVSESMAKQIEDAASSALADLGQISNEI